MHNKKRGLKRPLLICLLNFVKAFKMVLKSWILYQFPIHIHLPQGDGEKQVFLCKSTVEHIGMSYKVIVGPGQVISVRF